MHTEPKVAILLVDDQPANLLALEAVLADPGHELVRATSGAEALARLLARDFAVVLLDVQMHGLDGFETARRIRGRDRSHHTPIIFLTARDASEDKVSGLRLGGDDYVTKPFGLEEIVARIEAVLRRSSGTPRRVTTLEVADLVLDDEAHEVRRGDDRVDLSATEYRVLRYLMLNAGRVLSKSQILEHVWQYDFDGESTVVETYISYLRKKIDTREPALIHTVRGFGYVLREDAGP